MNRVNIVMYHYVREFTNSKYPNIKGLDYNLFEKQIQFLRENYEIIKMEQLIECVMTGQQLPKNAALLTFDDGYIDHYQFVFPLLKKYGLQGSFFIPAKVFVEHTVLDVNKIHFVLAVANLHELINSLLQKLDYYRGREFDFPSNTELLHTYAVANRLDDGETVFVKQLLQYVLPEKLRNILADELFKEYIGISKEVFARELYLSHEQIKIMKMEGMYIGIHGYDHYWLGELPQDKMNEDIDKALDVMDEFIDKNAWVMNYPYGNFSQAVIDYIKRKGCCMGLTTEREVAVLDKCNKYLLPRLDTNDFPPKSDNYKLFV